MDKPALTHRHFIAAVAAVVACIATSVVLTRAQQQRQTATTIETLAGKVKNLEDVHEISNVLIAYGRALDSRDFKAYSALFTRDGSWSGGTGSVTGGPQAIYEFMTSRIGDGGRGIGFGPSYHIMSSFKIDPRGDTATVSSRWAFVTAARGPGIQVAGRYEDAFVREDGVWKIKSRQAFNDLAAPEAASPTGRGAAQPPGNGAPAK